MSEVTLTKATDHIWRVTFDFRKLGAWDVTAHFSDFLLDDGKVYSEKRTEDIKRNLVDSNGDYTPVIAETVTLASGKVISMSEIIEAGELFGQKWKAENEDNSK